jgi:hypothetical protein
MGSHRYSDEDFKKAVETSFSISEVLRKLGLAGQGGSYATFYARVKALGINTSHFIGQAHLKGKTHSYTKPRKLSELLISNGGNITTRIKGRIIKAGLLKNECYECGLKDKWNNKLVVLQLDHINGDHFDNRIENLRLLCPNCHSQTDTFCSKNLTINPLRFREGEFLPKEKHKCLDCGKIMASKNYTRCKDCFNFFRRKK